MENVKDIDGNSYKTVKIGDQIWMAENLKVTHYRNGEPILGLTNKNEWWLNSQAAYCNYDNDENNVKTYGRLYSWFALNDERGLAPAGWHISTNREWDELEVYLGGSWAGDAGGKLKSIGTIEGNDGLWGEPNRGATNESGFTALPGGYRNGYGFYLSLGACGYFWCSTESTGYKSQLFPAAWSWQLSHESTLLIRNDLSKHWGLSVRCIKD